jgi:thiol-disulfide isomerase/thioredoxin
MNSTLKIFVRDNCPGCREAYQLAGHVAQQFPQLKVEVINLADPNAIVPEAVFATPTYMLNNRIVSLGNPNLAEVARWAADPTVPPVC